MSKQERAAKSQRDFDRMKDAAEKSLQQTERYKNAKAEFEVEIYKKVPRCPIAGSSKKCSDVYSLLIASVESQRRIFFLC